MTHQGIKSAEIRKMKSYRMKSPALDNNYEIYELRPTSAGG